MLRTTTMTAAVALTALAGVSGLANAGVTSGETVIDFNNLVHGQIVTNQYASQGVDFSIVNFRRSHNIGAAFDTNLSDTRDPDLENPWDGGNLASNTDLGRILIIAENNVGASDGILDRPDDEGGRPAGTITMDFGRAVVGFGLDIVDIEGIVVENSALVFSLQGMEVGRWGFADLQARDTSIVFGNNSANHVEMLTSDEIRSVFDRVTIEVGGSAGFDNIRVLVPSPGALALAGAGGLLAFRRRR